jgi:hypothetical protein
MLEVNYTGLPLFSFYPRRGLDGVGDESWNKRNITATRT